MSGILEALSLEQINCCEFELRGIFALNYLKVQAQLENVLGGYNTAFKRSERNTALPLDDVLDKLNGQDQTIIYQLLTVVDGEIVPTDNYSLGSVLVVNVPVAENSYLTLPLAGIRGSLLRYPSQEDNTPGAISREEVSLSDITLLKSLPFVKPGELETFVKTLKMTNHDELPAYINEMLTRMERLTETGQLCSGVESEVSIIQSDTKMPASAEQMATLTSEINHSLAPHGVKAGVELLTSILEIVTKPETLEKLCERINTFTRGLKRITANLGLEVEESTVVTGPSEITDDPYILNAIGAVTREYQKQKELGNTNRINATKSYLEENDYFTVHPEWRDDPNRLLLAFNCVGYHRHLEVIMGSAELADHLMLMMANTPGMIADSSLFGSYSDTEHGGIEKRFASFVRHATASFQAYYPSIFTDTGLSNAIKAMATGNCSSIARASMYTEEDGFGYHNPIARPRNDMGTIELTNLGAGDADIFTACAFASLYELQLHTVCQLLGKNLQYYLPNEFCYLYEPLSPHAIQLGMQHNAYREKITMVNLGEGIISTMKASEYYQKKDESIQLALENIKTEASAMTPLVKALFNKLIEYREKYQRQIKKLVIAGE